METAKGPFLLTLGHFFLIFLRDDCSLRVGFVLLLVIFRFHNTCVPIHVVHWKFLPFLCHAIPFVCSLPKTKSRGKTLLSIPHLKYVCVDTFLELIYSCYLLYNSSGNKCRSVYLYSTIVHIFRFPNFHLFSFFTVSNNAAIDSRVPSVQEILERVN